MVYGGFKFDHLALPFSWLMSQIQRIDITYSNHTMLLYTHVLAPPTYNPQYSKPKTHCEIGKIAVCLRVLKLTASAVVL